MKKQIADLYFGSTDYKLALLSQRVELLEEKVLKKVRRIRATEAQRFLLYYHLGFIDPILQYEGVTQTQKNLLLSVMLDIDPDNIRKFLSELPKKEKPLLNTESNYTFLVTFFEENGFSGLKKTADKVLRSILNKKEK